MSETTTRRPLRYWTYYSEVQVPIGGLPQFPERCPVCGAPARERTTDQSGYRATARYDCGGGYHFKSQIQNHTDKWYGTCGLEAVEPQEVLARDVQVGDLLVPDDGHSGALYQVCRVDPGKGRQGKVALWTARRGTLVRLEPETLQSFTQKTSLLVVRSPILVSNLV